MESNVDKSKIMTNNPGGEIISIKVNNQDIKEVQNFKYVYLGSTINEEGSRP